MKALGWTLAALLAAFGCRPAPEPAAPDAAAPARLVVGTTCFPVDWLVTRIGADRIESRNVLPRGEDPPEWQPAAEVVVELSRARLIVVNGAGYERWMLTAALPTSRVVDTTQGLDLIEVEGHTHSHGPKGEHSHSGTDPHTWSDPRTFLAQAKAVHDALVSVDPGNREAYDRNFETLQADLRSLDAEFERALTPLSVRLASNHPSFGYLAQRYGLKIVPFAFDPQEPPRPEELRRFMDWAKGEPVTLLWEASPSPAVTRAFPGSIRHVGLDSLEQPRADRPYDYLSQARANLATLAGMVD